MYTEDQNKLEKLRYLLDSWADIWDGSPSVEPFASHSGSFGSSIPGKLPKMAHHSSVRELVRCLDLLRAASPGDYRHLQVYRFGAEWRGTYCWVRIKLPSGRHDIIAQRTSERVLPRWLDPRRVRSGEDFLCRVFKGEVYVPDEIYPRFLSLRAA